MFLLRHKTNVHDFAVSKRTVEKGTTLERESGFFEKYLKTSNVVSDTNDSIIDKAKSS